jgi:hypothetical protein
MNDEFEQKLSRQPLGEIPSHWRKQILAAAQQQSHVSRRGFFPAALFRLPMPVIRWGALAAVWVVIFALNHAARDNSPRTFAKAEPPSPQMILALREQKKMFAELIGPPLARDVEKPKPFLPRPRSEHYSQLLKA